MKEKEVERWYQFFQPQIKHGVCLIGLRETWMENGERNRMREKETQERGREALKKDRREEEKQRERERERGIEERQEATGPRMMISLHTFSRKEVEREKKVGGVRLCLSLSLLLSFFLLLFSLSLLLSFSLSLQICKIRTKKIERGEAEKSGLEMHE